MVNITWQIFLFDGLACKHASAQIVFTAVTTGLNKRYFLFCDCAWKLYPVYIISQTKCITNIFIWQSCLKTWFNADCHHSNYEMLKWNLFFVSLPSLKMFCSVYYQLLVHSKYFWQSGLKTFHGHWLQQ